MVEALLIRFDDLLGLAQVVVGQVFFDVLQEHPVNDCDLAAVLDDGVPPLAHPLPLVWIELAPFIGLDLGAAPQEQFLRHDEVGRLEQHPQVEAQHELAGLELLLDQVLLELAHPIDVVVDDPLELLELQPGLHRQLFVGIRRAQKGVGLRV